jgi:hypothetical protein
MVSLLILFFMIFATRYILDISKSFDE